MDDCSTDTTPEMVAEYVKKDSRVKYFRNKKNLRLPRNLNRGFSLAKGNYLTWTSDDNVFMPTALEKMYLALKGDPETQFAYASCDIIEIYSVLIMPRRVISPSVNLSQSFFESADACSKEKCSAEYSPP